MNQFFGGLAIALIMLGLVGSVVLVIEAIINLVQRFV